MVNILEQALLALLLVVLMAGMGASLTLSDFRGIGKRPKGVLVGLASQFGWMPLIAFGLAKALALPNEVAIGIILIGCTPGGTTSNLFTYFSKADVALSVTMTSVSTLVAVILMPLVLSLYAAPFTSAELQVPLDKIAITLVLVLVPVAIGMAVRAKAGLEIARKLERVGSLAGVVVLVVLLASGVIRNGAVFFEISTGTYLSAIGLSLIGMSLGWLSARALGLPSPQRRAIAFETGIQNSPLAIAIVMIAFETAQADRIVKAPLLYALFVLIIASVVTMLFRTAKRQPSPQLA